MASLWIVHRNPLRLAALRHLTGPEEDCLAGSPAAAEFRDADPPRVVLLGLAGDLEAELEFAHRQSVRAPRARWILLAEPADRTEARRVFDVLPAEILSWPPDPDELRGRIRAAVGARRVERLSDRRIRDAVAARFARWFADLDSPALLRALDPTLAWVPVLVRGERGTGRLVLARYLHAFGGGAGGALVHVACGPDVSLEGIAAAIAAGPEGPADPEALTVCLEDADDLPPAVQRALRRWIELPPPEAGARRLRWIACVGDDEGSRVAPRLERSLAEALAGISIRIPPLRERPDALARVAAETVRDWCRAQGQRLRELAPDALVTLGEYPWPGNLRELEAVLVRTLSTCGDETLHADRLRFGGREAAAPATLPTRAAPVPLAPPTEVLPEEVETPLAAEAPEAAAAEEATAAAAPGPEPEAPPGPGADPLLRRLLAALSHEVRNPLATIRTFASLIPERADDAEFRERFRELVGRDLARIEALLERLDAFASLESGPPGVTDISALLGRLLEARRAEIVQRRLLVLTELEGERPRALADPEALEFGLGALVAAALAAAPDRADLYFASKHHRGGLRAAPSLRVLIRFPAAPAAARPGRGPAAALSPLAHALELVLAEAVVRTAGGRLSLDAGAAGETLIVVDLPAAD
jgi:DNA-binding NtrC family response regulator